MSALERKAVMIREGVEYQRSSLSGFMMKTARPRRRLRALPPRRYRPAQTLGIGSGP